MIKTLKKNPMNRIFLLTLSLLLVSLFCMSSIRFPTGSFDNAKNTEFLDNHSPKSSATNIRITLNDLNMTHGERGEIIPLSGNIIWFNGAWVNLSNYDVYPVVNNVSMNGLNGNANLSVLTDADGDFLIYYVIPLNFDITQNMTIYANITESSGDNIYVDEFSFITPPFELDIHAKSIIGLTSDISEPILTNDVYNLIITLVDDNNVPIETSEVFLYGNDDVGNVLQTNITIDNTGQVILNFTQIADLAQLGVGYPGLNLTTIGVESYYQIAPVNLSIDISRILSVSTEFTFVNGNNATISAIYTGGDVQVLGTFWVNNNTNLPLHNREIDLIFSNGVRSVSVGIFTTDNYGQLDEIISLATNGFASNASITVSAEVRNGGVIVLDGNEVVYTTNMVLIIVDEPAPLSEVPDSGAIQPAARNWIGILIPGIIVAAIIAGLVLFQRYRMEKSHKSIIKLRKVDMEKFAIMNMLFQVNRRREAIAYSYKIFSDLILEKYGLNREKNQTLREFAIMCVTKYGLDPLRTYPYIALVENVTYGAYDLTSEAYERAMKVFGRIYQEITGTVLNFALDITEETRLMEGVTIKIGGE
ncbi:MAG: hypothetical protein ACTSYI_17170 [Promethearchaeota archaeon]